MGLFNRKSKEEKTREMWLEDETRTIFAGMETFEGEKLSKEFIDAQVHFTKTQQQRAKCLKCKAEIVNKDGTKLFLSMSNQFYSGIVMCGECGSLFSIDTTKDFKLVKDITNKKSEYFLKKYL